MQKVVTKENQNEGKRRCIVVSDVGGTHARFAIASLRSSDVTLSGLVTLPTRDYESFVLAWQDFARRSGGGLPSQAAIAVAGDAGRDVIELTNSPWAISAAQLGRELDLEQLTIVNDFGAIAHAIPRLDQSHFKQICGPAKPLPEEGVITIVGPGTGLGVASLLMRRGGSYEVIECEGGHMDFAPLDSFEEFLLSDLRADFGRVSVERIVSGPGLLVLYRAMARIEGWPPRFDDDRALWAAAIGGSDSHAVAALDRYCLCLGAIAGDLALAQGARCVAIAGGIGLRLFAHVASSRFCERFIAKGRFRQRMEEMPVQLIIHPQPGLVGAAAAFLREHSV